jgi:hypothetical protein
MDTNNERITPAGAGESGRQATADTANEPQTVQVLTRFDRAELDAMKEETGANADATAVACFVRKNLRKRG